MRETKFLCSLLLLFTINLSAQAQETYTHDEVKEDLSFLYKKLVKLHPGLYRYQDSTAFHKAYSQGFNQEGGIMDAVKAFQTISPLVTGVKDLHTGIYPSKKWFKSNKKTIPLYLYKNEGKYLISYSCIADSNVVRGTEVTHVGGQSVDSLWYETTKLYGPDNGNEASTNYYSTYRFFTYLRYIQHMPDSLEIGFKSPQDSVWNVWVKPIVPKEFNKRFAKKYPHSSRKNLSYEVLDSTTKVAKINITSFKVKGRFLQSGTKKFKKKFKALMAQVERDSIEHLALDVRSNGGGSIANIPQVVRYFTDEPFAISHQWSMKKEAFWNAFPIYAPMLPLVGAIYFKTKVGDYRVRTADRMTMYRPAKKYLFDGDLYIFGNGGSYSATTFTTSLLMDKGLATYIGSRAGGAKWGSYAGRWYSGKLPNTKIRFRIPYYKIEHNLKSIDPEYFFDPDFFIEPDYKVSPTMEQFLNKEDANEQFLIDLVKSDS